MKAHLKRVAVPRTWAIERKETVFITRPYPGGHSMDYSMSISVAMRYLIKCAKTRKEVKYILQNKNIQVDGRRRKDDKGPVGLMDVVQLTETGENFRISLTPRGKLCAIKVPKGEETVKISRINGITKIKGGQTQLNLSDGRNKLVDKDNYKLGDSILLTLPAQEVKEHFALKEGAITFLLAGKYAGATGTVKKIHGKVITVEVGKESFVTAKRYAFVVGDKKPVITLQ
jgi:small subunit ribosomal protein S4e